MVFLIVYKIKRIFLLFKKAYSPYKRQILILAVIGFIGGLLEGIGVNALIPFFAFVTGQPFEGSNFISTFIESAFHYFHIDFSIKYLLVFIAALFIVKAVIVFWGKYTQNLIFVNYGKQLRMLIVRETLDAEWIYLLNQKVGYLSTILTTEAVAVATLLGTISAVMLTMTTISVYIFMAFLISWQATAATFVLGVFLIAISKPLIDRARGMMREKVNEIKESTHFINETTLGAKVIKSSSSVPLILGKADAFFENFRRIKLRYFIYRGIMSSTIQPISVIFISIIFVFLYKTPGFNIGSFIALVYLIQRIFTHINQIDSDIHKINENIPYLQSVISYIERIREHRETSGGEDSFVFNKEFLMQDVSFSYKKGGDLLHGVDFSLKKGEIAGIIGPSGAGKTTFVDIVLRLLSPHGGAIFLDGNNVVNISLEEWRRNVAYVSQDIHLINDTIAHNISFYTALSRDEIENAAKDANIYDFIMSLPKGFGTMIGERGIKLSAGQRQRIVIARALARNPKLLILDEATSALDNESESRVQETIENLRGKVTMIIVAHRLGTVHNCDTIFVLKDGYIVEKGNPQTLLKNDETYFYKMHNLHKQEPNHT